MSVFCEDISLLYQCFYGPMAHQMVQEGVLWPSSMIRLGPHWRNSKIAWTDIVHADWIMALKHNKVTIFNQVGAVKNTITCS